MVVTGFKEFVLGGRSYRTFWNGEAARGRGGRVAVAYCHSTRTAKGAENEDGNGNGLKSMVKAGNTLVYAQTDGDKVHGPKPKRRGCKPLSRLWMRLALSTTRLPT
jgi:hypothetical protein